MITAREKKKENIVEYLLYMWQIEDMIRACGCEMEEIERQLISKYDADAGLRSEIWQWYAALVDMMRNEGVLEKGHLQANINIADELNGLHQRLLKAPGETVYGSLYYKALPAIVQLRAKSGDKQTGEIETCLTALYGYMLLKIKNQEISEGTTESVKQFGAMLSYLAAKYHEDKQ
ncbi:MAG: DUF4924 family protein [Tannerella sp.]|jgi:hypothetical protein|nr:DUF4924 family protein [Tannerella sp.]